jgi:hypothetical protein
VVNAIHRIPKLKSSLDQPGGLLICVTRDELLFCSLIAQEHGIAKHLPFEGVPKRVLYSQFLQHFAVAFLRDGDPYDPPPRRPPTVPLLPGEKDPANRPPPKVQRVGVQLVTSKLRYPQAKDEDSSTFSTLVTADENDIIHDFIDWKPTDGLNHYEWLVLAIEQPMIVPPGPGRGRVVCVNAKSLGKGKPDANAKVVYADRDPVTAICAYKKSSLLVACGKEVVLRHLDFSTRRWATLSRHSIPSCATAISCQGSLICVATRDHALFVLVERDNKLQQHRCNAGVRYGKDVVMLDTSTAVFASADASGTDIIGYAGLNKETSEATALFHAKMPGHIHRFRTDSSYGSAPGRRVRFYGGAIDGTLFHFSLLQHKEWRLLHFIEQLSYLDQRAIKAVPMKKRDTNGHEFLWKPAPHKPKDMHVRGDRLVMMVEDGPYNLRNVLQGQQRMDTFNTLVADILGETDQPVEVAIAWVRKMLRFPPGS